MVKGLNLYRAFLPMCTQGALDCLSESGIESQKYFDWETTGYWSTLMNV